MEKYTEVSNIITGKDLDYLSDMFESEFLKIPMLVFQKFKMKKLKVF